MLCLTLRAERRMDSHMLLNIWGCLNGWRKLQLELLSSFCCKANKGGTKRVYTGTDYIYYYRFNIRT